MPHSFHPYLHPSFVSVLSSHRCENSQRAFATMGPFTHLSLISASTGVQLSAFSTCKQVPWQITTLTCTSDSSAGSDGAQADFATLNAAHRRPAVMLLMNGWTSVDWSPFKPWCMECLVVGGGLRLQSCFVFTSWGLSVGGLGEAFCWFVASQWRG